MKTILNPYESPRAATLVGPNCSVFRMRFLPIFALAATVTVVGLTLADLITGPSDPVVLLIAITATLVVQALVAGWATLQLRVFVSAEGIRGTDHWCRYREFHWSAITKVRKTSILWLKYLKVYSEGSRWPIWLPLFLCQQQRFWTQVNRLAPGLRDMNEASHYLYDLCDENCHD